MSICKGDIFGLLEKIQATSWTTFIVALIFTIIHIMIPHTQVVYKLLIISVIVFICTIIIMKPFEASKCCQKL